MRKKHIFAQRKKKTNQKVEISKFEKERTSKRSTGNIQKNIFTKVKFFYW